MLSAVSRAHHGSLIHLIICSGVGGRPTLFGSLLHGSASPLLNIANGMTGLTEVQSAKKNGMPSWLLPNFVDMLCPDHGRCAVRQPKNCVRGYCSERGKRREKGRWNASCCVALELPASVYRQDDDPMESIVGCAERHTDVSLAGGHSTRHCIGGYVTAWQRDKYEMATLLDGISMREVISDTFLWVPTTNL